MRNTSFESGLGRRQHTLGQFGAGTQHTHMQSKTLYGAGTKGLFPQWPFALQWGVAGMLTPERGHKHHAVELRRGGGGSVGCNTQSAAQVQIIIFALLSGSYIQSRSFFSLNGAEGKNPAISSLHVRTV